MCTMWSHTSFSRSRSWLTISSVWRKRCRCSVSQSMRLEVEMVRRLVEDQEVGIAEQRAGQRHAHAPAAGELAAGPRLRGVVEAQAMQDRGGPRRRRGRADLVEPGMDVGQPQSVVAGLGFGQQRGALDVGGQHGVEDGDVAAGRVLRHRADAVSAAQADAAAVGLDAGPGSGAAGSICRRRCGRPGRPSSRRTWLRRRDRTARARRGGRRGH